MTFRKARFPSWEQEGWPIKEAAKGRQSRSGVPNGPAGVVNPEEFRELTTPYLRPSND
jgi:hypothetical protein